MKCIFEGIVSNRIDDENKQKEETLREFELQKIRVQNETQRVVGPQTLPQTKIELKTLLPAFNPEVDNMDLFLTLFKRQMKLLDLGEDLWVHYISLVSYLVMYTVKINHRKIPGAVFMSQKKPKWDVEGLLF
ncbi:uncharacterized protein TNCV_2832511 [Trichonephila clavipes]|nr:uncharacterized protein TNCV_2832511 [Trichonephila clavipes]